LFTLFPFNRNDTTGASVLSDPLPYVIGRATIGNINSPVATDSSGAATVTGTATTKLNYPSSMLNRGVVIWAQGTGPDTAFKDSNGNPTTRLVTDAIMTTYPAVADLIVSASPNPIAGNTTVAVNVCVTDAQHVPVPGLRFRFNFTDLGVGSGEVDGVAGSGWTENVTGADGCVVANVSTQGIAGSSGSGGGSGSSGTPTVTFVAAGYSAGSTASVAIPITASGDLILKAKPSALPGTGGTVTLTLLSGNGVPVPGVQLTVQSCTGNTVGVASGPGVTGADGSTQAVITASLDSDSATTAPGSGSCTFTTATGSPTATVNLQGACLNSGGCSSSGSPGSGNSLTVTVITGPATSSATVTWTGSPLSPPPACSVNSASSTQTCGPWAIATTVTQTMVATSTAGVTWSNGCSGSGTSATVPISGASTCTATFP
jgi:hypothetical protein